MFGFAGVGSPPAPPPVPPPPPISSLIASGAVLTPSPNSTLSTLTAASYFIPSALASNVFTVPLP